MTVQERSENRYGALRPGLETDVENGMTFSSKN